MSYNHQYNNNQKPIFWNPVLNNSKEWYFIHLRFHWLLLRSNTLILHNFYMVLSNFITMTIYTVCASWLVYQDQVTMTGFKWIWRRSMTVVTNNDTSWIFCLFCLGNNWWKSMARNTIYIYCICFFMVIMDLTTMAIETKISSIDMRCDVLGILMAGLTF